MYEIQTFFALIFLAFSVQLHYAQVEDARACSSCCSQLNEGFDIGEGENSNVFNLFTCQTIGCVIDQQPCNELQDPFARRGCEIGEQIRLTGTVLLPDGDEFDANTQFFCSVGGELSFVEFEDSTQTLLLNNNSQCASCCNQLNDQFDRDTNDQYSFQACTERCNGFVNIPSNQANIDVFDEGLGRCVIDADDNLNGKPNFFFNGCVQGDQFLKQGFVDFKGIRHFCQNIRTNSVITSTNLESVGAVKAQTTSDDVVGSADNDCSACCDILDAELDEVGEGSSYDVNSCKEDGCHANLLCENLDDAAQVRGCELGKAFLTSGKVSFLGNNVICLRGGDVQGALEDVNVLLQSNNDLEAIAAGVGGALGGLLLLSIAVIIWMRRRRQPRVGDMSPPQVRDDYDYDKTRGFSNRSDVVYLGNGQFSREVPKFSY